MYLSCLEIRADTTIGRRWLANPYRVHQRLHLAFPDGEPGGRLLFRIEADHNPPRILVQAPRRADWDQCFRDLPVLASPPRQKEVLLRLAAGQRLRFMLRANPTVRRQREETTSDGRSLVGKRLGLLREVDQRAWLERKAVAGGFRPLAYEVRSHGRVTIRRGEDASICQTHVVTDFEGQLEVIDPELLRETVERGIGAGKGFGFGLLSLARADA